MREEGFSRVMTKILRKINFVIYFGPQCMCPPWLVFFKNTSGSDSKLSGEVSLISTEALCILIYESKVHLLSKDDKKLQIFEESRRLLVKMILCVQRVAFEQITFSLLL